MVFFSRSSFCYHNISVLSWTVAEIQPILEVSTNQKPAFQICCKKWNSLKIWTIWRITQASILNGCRNIANNGFRPKNAEKQPYVNFWPIRSQNFKFAVKKLNSLKIRTIWCFTHASILNGCRNIANNSFQPKNAEKQPYIIFRPIRSQHFKFAVKNETRWKSERFGVLHMLLSWTVAEI